MDKVALVTGGARRIGAAIAETLHHHGYRIIIHYHRSSMDANILCDRLNVRRDNSAATLQANLVHVSLFPELVDKALALFGRIDALINNASSFFPTRMGEISEAAWDDLVGTNVKAPVFLSQALANELKKNHGVIVNIADIHAERPMRDHLVYNVAKAALAAATRSLARELGPEVRVNAVAPGANVWPENNSMFDPTTRERILATCILKRLGNPKDIAETVRFLVTGAEYITGQIINVDGGRSIVLSD